MVDYDLIYPNINEVSQPEVKPIAGENFRLYKVNTALNQLNSELLHYGKVRKKYARLRSFFHGTSINKLNRHRRFFIGVSLGGLGAFFGIISGSCAIATKKITKKISKQSID